MRPALRRSALALWGATATILLVRFWYASPDSFPSPLRHLGKLLVGAAGVHDADAAADFELLFVACVAALVVGAVTWGAGWIWRRAVT